MIHMQCMKRKPWINFRGFFFVRRPVQRKHAAEAAHALMGGSCVIGFLTKTMEGTEILTSFLIAVMAGVVCHCIIKWLDGDNHEN